MKQVANKGIAKRSLLPVPLVPSEQIANDLRDRDPVDAISCESGLKLFEHAWINGMYDEQAIKVPAAK